MHDQKYLTSLLIAKFNNHSNSIKAQWAEPHGTKTRHFIVDDLLPENICRAIYEAFPKDGDGFFNRESFRERKKTSAHLKSFDPILANITYAFQDIRIVELISNLVEFEHIEPDPKLYAGGLSMMFHNDFLNPHIDNSHDSERRRYRRLNLLYYVSPNWNIENGGNFELWNDDKSAPKTIFARSNRLVVMETNKTSWHSVSKVKVHEPRCCISNYYFSKLSPDASKYFHVTTFTGRPDENMRKIFGFFDNAIRNLVSITLKFGRGKKHMNK